MRTGFAPHPYLGDGHVSNVRIGTELKKESWLEQMIREYPAEKLPTVRSSLEYIAGDRKHVEPIINSPRIFYDAAGNRINVESELHNPGIRGRGLDMLGDLLGLPRECVHLAPFISRPESDREYRIRLLEAV